MWTFPYHKCIVQLNSALYLKIISHGFQPKLKHKTLYTNWPIFQIKYKEIYK